MQKIIKWILSLFKTQKQSEVIKPKSTFPKAKGYVIYTKDNNRLYCRSQKDVADALGKMYSLQINREHVHHALARHKGRLTYEGLYIATIIYRKEY